ncbi:hypothetical protein [Streptomyces sp. JNUCC 63]
MTGPAFRPGTERRAGAVVIGTGHPDTDDLRYHEVAADAAMDHADDAEDVRSGLGIADC